MPSHRTHAMFHPRKYDYVDRWKDAPAAYLGKSHRRERHDSASNLGLALKKGDPFVFVYGEAHDLVDKAVSEAKTKLAKQLGVPRELIDLLVKI